MKFRAIKTVVYLASGILIALAPAVSIASPAIAMTYQSIGPDCVARSIQVLKEMGTFNSIEVTSKGNVIAESDDVSIMVLCEVPNFMAASASADYYDTARRALERFNSIMRR